MLNAEVVKLTNYAGYDNVPNVDLSGVEAFWCKKQPGTANEQPTLWLLFHLQSHRQPRISAGGRGIVGC
jgi:hypothetical protein